MFKLMKQIRPKNKLKAVAIIFFAFVFFGLLVSTIINAENSRKLIWEHNLQMHFVYAEEKMSNKTDRIPPKSAPDYPKIGGMERNKIRILVKMNEAGKVYYIVLKDNKEEPTPLQIRLGKGTKGENLSAWQKGNTSLDQNGEGSILLQGVQIKQPYNVYIVTEDLNGNLQKSTQMVKLDSFREITDVLNNPYMGWAPDARDNENYIQEHQLVYAGITWKQLEPIKGQYDFIKVEKNNNFAYWRAKGKKVILRLILDLPSSKQHRDIPDWLYEETGDGIDYDIDYGKGYSPKYDNERLIMYHEKLLNELGKRYNNDPFIALVEIGSIGHWGEFHTYYNAKFDIPFPSLNIVNQYLQHYISSFGNKKLLVRRPLPTSNNYKFGYFNDSFGDEDQVYNHGMNWLKEGYLYNHTREKHPAMTDWWLNAPVGGEFPSGEPESYFSDTKMDGLIRMANDLHLSWLGPSCPVLVQKSDGRQHNLDTLLNKMGYRFGFKDVAYVNKVKAGHSLTVAINWFNKGVAPFYYNWPLMLTLSDSKGNIVATENTFDDVEKWLPGEWFSEYNFMIPESLKPGIYTLCVGIIDPETNKPGISFAIKGKRPDGWQQLGIINVE